MKYIQLKLSTLLIMSLAFSAICAQNININLKNGFSVAYHINETRKLTFNTGNMIVTKKDGITSSFAISNINSFGFSAGETTGFNKSMQKTNVLKVYPNPVQDILTLSLFSDVSKQLDIDVLGVDGKVIYSNAINAQQAQSHTINVSTWKGGMYLIRINDGNVTITTKFIKK